MISSWTLSKEQVAQKLQSNGSTGLSDEEAKSRLEKYGPNALPEEKAVSILAIFIEQFSSFIIWVLIVAALIAGFLGEWVDAAAILVIVVVNALLGFVQEWRSIRAMEALTKLEHPLAKVVRNGVMKQVPIETLVPGDLIVVEAGDQIPADARLVTSYHLKVQEAALTGESVGVAKTVQPLPGDHLPIGDRTNMIFRGTAVDYGKGVALVTSTGLETEIGKIAQLLQSIEEGKTPLQIHLENLGRKLVWLCLGIVGVIFLVGYAKGMDVYELLLTSLSLAVAAIPEGLPAVVTISLAIGMQRMAKKKALIRRLSAVETLGCTTVICTDKTGTLTENTMRVKEIWLPGKLLEMTGKGYEPVGKFLLEGKETALNGEREKLFKIAALCNSASLLKEDNSWKMVGDPTEGALLVAAVQAGVDLKKIKELHPILDELPFDSDRKMMSVVTDEELLLKGAPEAVLPLSTHIVNEEGEKEFTEQDKKQVLEVLSSMTAKGLRVLAFGFRKGAKEEKEITFVGLVGMQDPPRLEAKHAISTCIKAGIQPMMITGDHKDTALSIGKQLDFSGRAIDGSEMEAMDDRQLLEQVENVEIYSRVSAQHKMRIVDALQKRGEVVAMTGDGVNDAPAIEKADIGVAMGITGTDVTKSVSDMVILDDNFETIVDAVEEGRGIYDNMVKFISYLLSCNLAEILVIFVSVFFMAEGVEALVILAPIHLLWINLVTDGLPAVALAMDPVSPGAMLRPPRDPRAHFLSTSWLVKLCVISVAIAVLTLTIFQMFAAEDPYRARVVAFTTLVVLELNKPFILRLPYQIPMLSNPFLYVAVGSSMLLQLVVLYMPWFHVPMKTAPLTLSEWGWIAGAALILWGIAAPLMTNRIFAESSSQA